MMYFVKDCPIDDKPYWDSLTVESRYCKAQNMWVLKTEDELGLFEVDYSTVKNYFKTGF